MRVDAFDFELPKELIAEHPVEPREAARLLVIGETLRDSTIADLPRLLRPRDLLVFNDTKVLPTRLVGRRGDASVEVTLHRDIGHGRWHAFARGVKRLKPGDRLEFADDLAAEVIEKLPGGDIRLDFAMDPIDLRASLERHGSMPLPPYIKRPRGGDPRDRRDYQTMFARNEGAVAAPTAGLHFTPSLMAALDAAGIAHLTVTLHVGAGTFLPVKALNTEDHVMHAENGTLNEGAAEQINRARAEGGRIIAVGSTSLRLIESAADERGHIHPFAGETRLFVVPGYRFRAIDRFITNFHLPRSTLFMLVAAFAGLGRMQHAYAHAMRERYRFFSYGDACLIEPGP
jgi:S-adenosylmethionine:tRNA ribosyltransferase-isomerase